MENKLMIVSSAQLENSWVIRNKETGEVVFETWQKSVADKVNKDKYEAIPIADHLASLSIKEARINNSLDI